MVGEASAANPWPQPAVNNFAGAKNGAEIGMARAFHFGLILKRCSRPGGPGLLTTSRFNDFELIDRPVGRGLAL
jgi:hypothetical protein